MLTRILFSRGKARLASTAALSNDDANNYYNFKRYNNDKTVDVICERPCIYQPILTGTWEDSIGMFQFQIIPSKKTKGYHVIDNLYKRVDKFGFTLLDYDDDETTNITFKTPWGEDDQLRFFNGTVAYDGEKIIWFGLKSNTEWFKIC